MPSIINIIIKNCCAGAESFQWIVQYSDRAFENWASDEPNNAGRNENCVSTVVNGQWNDVNCENQKFFVCKSSSGEVKIQYTRMKR